MLSLPTDDLERYSQMQFHSPVFLLLSIYKQSSCMEWLRACIWLRKAFDVGGQHRIRRVGIWALRLGASSKKQYFPTIALRDGTGRVLVQSTSNIQLCGIQSFYWNAPPGINVTVTSAKDFGTSTWLAE